MSYNNITLPTDAKVYLNLHPCLIKLDLHETKTPNEDINWVDNTLIKKRVKSNLQYKKDKIKLNK